MPHHRFAAVAVVAAIAALSLTVGTGASAHDLALTGGEFATGYTLPLSSLAALLGFVGIGLWSGQLGGNAVWQLPAVALAVSVPASLIGEAGVIVPHTGEGLMVALVAIGVLMVLAVRLPLLSPWGVVALVAVFEGYPLAGALPHGSPLPAWVGYGAAALLAMAGGLGLAVMMPALIRFRVFGIGLAAAGVAMLLDKI